MKALPPKARPPMAVYLMEIQRFPLLPPEVEEAVASRFREHEREEDYHTLIQSNLRFVVKVARQFEGGLLPLEDLISEGNLGLLRAARRFDHTRGNRFLSCAIWWIRKAILDALENRAALIHVPRHQMKKVTQARRLGAELSGKLGRRAEMEEISRAMGVGIRELEEVRGSLPRNVSMDAPVGEDGTRSLAEMLPDPGADSPEQALLRKERRERVRSAVRRLGSREIRLISQRFGLGGYRSRTLHEVGEELGVSREAVRQMEARARGKLARFLAQDAFLNPPGTRRIS